ncbi:flagellar hook-associated protein FlgL [Candidatus Colwellia aromaticivorans]|uniref:flagellar hook-associated protein FlgL n=1 Tax=Candidatus Colwellia aromaticivorans TaxID=2267621 RepID=UPI000DF23999|nr:flagellar hook-associated protein FlgL [Candidatus Colwellia aromaticivorans]
MRVSTAQFYQQSSLQMSSKTSDVNEQMAYLTSGKRVLTAKDDAVQYGTLVAYKESLANIEKYQRNITLAESHNSLQEIVFADAETILDQVKQDMLLANNGRMSTEDLQSLATQTRNNFSQLLDIANSQDANGDYIFSGYQTEQKPFSQQVDGSVFYSGDTGVNELPVAKNINVTTNQTGDAAFLKVANSIGDFKASYNVNNTSDVAVESANITNRNTYNASTIPHNYTFTFGPGAAELDVVDGGVSVYNTTSYVAGQNIPLSNGVDVTLSGNPLPDDTFTLSEQEDISIFETINDAIAWMESGSVSTNQKQHQVDYNSILNQLNSAMTHITSRRVDSGIRLQVLESQKSRHLDSALNISSSKSNIEDLDFAKAISEFEQSKVALQASQQAFSKIQNLTLFNYI